MIVLDTHALIWAVQDDDRLGTTARKHIEREAQAGNVLVPAICAWEVALLVSRRRIELMLDPARWMQRILNRPGYMLAALEPAIAIASVDLAWSHKDPADRMIVATARHWAAPLMTADDTITQYAQAGQLQVIDALQ